VEVESMRIHGKFEVLKGGRNRIHSRVDWSTWPSERFGADGNVVWTTYPAGFRILQREQAEVWKLEASSWSDLRPLGTEMETVGKVGLESPLNPQTGKSALPRNVFSCAGGKLSV
jgi:hypothetical protein